MADNKKTLSHESTNLTYTFIIPEKTNSEYVKKDSFILYADQQEIFENLSDEKAGKLIKGIFQYTFGNEPKFNDLLKLVFIPIRQQLDRNAKKYEETKEKRRIAGSKGGKQRQANQANANFAKQTQANQAVNVNDNVYVNDNVNIINKDKRNIFIIPSIEEIKTYCLERKNNVNPQTFYDYYSSNGWKVGKNSMKDWRATVRNWERNSKQTNREEQTEYVYNPNL